MSAFAEKNGPAMTISRFIAGPDFKIIGSLLPVIFSRLFSPLSRRGRRQAARCGARFLRASIFWERLWRGVRGLGRRDSLVVSNESCIQIVILAAAAVVNEAELWNLVANLVVSFINLGQRIFAVLPPLNLCNPIRYFNYFAHFRSPNSTSGLVQFLALLYSTAYESQGAK